MHMRWGLNGKKTEGTAECGAKGSAEGIAGFTEGQAPAGP